MKSVSGEDLARSLESHGWQLKRINGRHHIYGKEGGVVRLSLPIHANQPLKQGLLAHLLKQAGLRKEDL